jgi:serine/threonine-protein kinase
MPGPSEDAPNMGEAERAPSRPLPGDVISGRYRVAKLLATGGVSSVYLAQHVHMLKHVAIKVLDPSAEKLPEFVARFRREAVAGAHLQHPNIASATDFGQLEDGSYFLVQEYVAGETLNRVIAGGALSASRATSIARKLASALGAAHEVGIVHRDVKPSNVILVEGTEDVVKLIDFGFAKLRFSDVPTLAPPPEEPVVPERLLTAAGVVLGTVAYMAPEAALGMAAVDQRSDLYALGLILYELLTGLHPFDGTDPVRLFLQQRTEPPPAMAKRVPGLQVPSELENVVRRLLEKDPKDRYATATDVVAALDAAVMTAGFEIVPEMSAAARASRPPLGSRPSNPPLAPDLSDGARRSDAAIGALGSAPGASRNFAPESDGPATVAAHVDAGSAPRAPSLFNRALALPAIARAVAMLPESERFPRWAYVAFPLLAVVFLIAIVSLRARAGDAAEGAPSESNAPPASSSDTAAAAAAPREVTMEVAGLDASGWRMNLRNAVRKKEWPAASEAVLTLFRLDPAAFRDHDGQAALRNTAVGLEDAGGEAADKFFDALTGAGVEGLDLLYDIARARPGTKAGKRATEILRRPEVMMSASPALKVLFDFREASCVGRRDLFSRMAEQGDERALGELVGQRDADCGRRDPCCYKESRALGAAIRSLKARLSSPPPASPPQAP